MPRMRGASWGRSNQIVFDGERRHHDAGYRRRRNASQVTQTGFNASISVSDRWPYFLPMAIIFCTCTLLRALVAITTRSASPPLTAK